MGIALRTVGWMLAAVALLAGGAATWAQTGGAEDPFLKGLRDRGLTSLMEAYLQQKSAAVAAATATGTGGAARPTDVIGGKEMLATIEVQKALATRNMGEREESFKKARTLYEEAIAEATKTFAAIPLTALDQRSAARIQLLKLRLDLANLIFQKWLKDDLDLLEISDRRAGDPNHAAQLLKVSLEQYRAIATDSRAWLSEFDQLSKNERAKMFNTGIDRNLKRMQQEAKYNEAWVTYYYAWLLPEDFKAAKGERSRRELLEDSITAFQGFTTVSDRVTAKWFSYLGSGLAYRELGKYDESLQSLATAGGSKAPDMLRLRIPYETAMTYLKKCDFKKARDACDDAISFWKDAVNKELHGMALPLVKAQSFILEAKAKDNPKLREEGVKILEDLHGRPNPWPTVVQAVMTDLLGKTEVTAETDNNVDPFQLWLAAVEAKDKGLKTKDPKEFEKAAALFKKFIEKAGPKDKNYPAALQTEAACLLQLDRKAEAAACFQKVADEFPAYEGSPAASKYAVGLRGELYENAKTDENLAAYETTLKWFTTKWLKEDPDQRYYYGYALHLGKKYVEAADAFSRVDPKAEHYPDSKYWVPLCRLEEFREKTLASRDKTIILTQARTVGQELLAFTDYAAGATGLSDEKKEQLTAWAKTAYINVADIYLYPEVGLPADALPVLDAMEKKYTLDDEERGRVLKLRIDACQKLNRFDDAQKALDDFLKIAKKEEVGPVLRGLFKALTDDVRELINRNQKDLAAAKVGQAKGLGERLRKWLDENGGADKLAQIENNRYDLAELYLAVGDYVGALAIYQEIGGTKPWAPGKGPDGKDIPLKVDCAYGQARCYEGLAEQAQAAGNAAEAKRNFETAMEAWAVLRDIAESERNKDMDQVWTRRYHVFYCWFNADKEKNAKDVLQTLKAQQIMDTLGGRDLTLQKKFINLMNQAAVVNTPGQAAPVAATGS